MDIRSAEGASCERIVPRRSIHTKIYAVWKLPFCKVKLSHQMPDVDHVEPQIFIDIQCYSFIGPYCSTFDLRRFAKTAWQAIFFCEVHVT